MAKGKQTDLDALGAAKNAREEKPRAKKQQPGQFTPEDEKMAELYRQHVLKEQPTIKIAGLGGKKKPVQDLVHNKPE